VAAKLTHLTSKTLSALEIRTKEGCVFRWGFLFGFTCTLSIYTLITVLDALAAAADIIEQGI
jgi:hypothetical protein